MMSGPTTNVGPIVEGMAEDTVASYDVDVHAIRVKILEMGDLATKMMVDSVDALTTGNTAVARSVISADIALDHLQRDVEEQSIQMIARRSRFRLIYAKSCPLSGYRVTSDGAGGQNGFRPCTSSHPSI
jgi:phosphate transport system protein